MPPLGYKGSTHKTPKRISTRRFVSEEWFCASYRYTQAPASANSLLCSSFLRLMAPTLSKPQRVVVGKPGFWKKTTLDNKKKVEKFTQREFVAPVPWLTYAREGRRVTTNVKLVRRTWQRPVGSTSSGTELPEVAVSPPSARRRKASWRVFPLSVSAQRKR